MRLNPSLRFIALASLLAGCQTVPADREERRIAPNDNRTTAGAHRGDTIEVSLTVQRGRWYPASDSGPHADVLAFAEVGGAPSIPGPFLRARSGMVMRIRVENPLPDSVLTVHGLHTRPGGAVDTVRVRPGETRVLEFPAGEPGTYYYWASAGTSTLDDRPAESSQLVGALVIDPADGPRWPDDRVFVMTVYSIGVDSSGPKPWVPIDEMTINGKSWPYTERFDLTTGQTVHWRWVNPNKDAHPMHLHGFYFTLHSRGDGNADTLFAPDREVQIVTELMRPGATMAMSWTPVTPGNWLFHCHFAFHVSHFLSVHKVPDPEDPGAPDAVDHSVHGMRGLILGLRVRDAGGGDAAPAQGTRVRRSLRLTAAAVPARYGPIEGLGYVIGSDPITPDDVPVYGPTITLRRGEPAAITVVNALRAPTAVHWHGIELEDSYSDGVPGWSGTEARLAPAIAPRDSFVARFTPPRAGTFMYHSHSNEGHQISRGLYGALLVLDPAVPYDTTTDHVIVIGDDPPPAPAGGSKGRVNGSVTPPPLRLRRGATHRLRLVSINPNYRVLVRLMDGDRLLDWEPVAKDGADLPPALRTARPGRIVMGPGETMDVQIRAPATPSDSLRLVTEAELGGWSITMPVHWVAR